MDELSFLSEEDILLYKKNLRSEMSVFSKKTKKIILVNLVKNIFILVQKKISICLMV